MRRWAPLLVGLALFALPARALAAPPAEGRGPLGLDEVLASLDARSPTLAAADADLRAARGEVLAAAGGFDPKVKVKGEWEAVGYYQNASVDTSVEQPTRLHGLTVFAGYRIGRGKFPIYDYKYFTNTGGEARAGLRLPLLRDGAIDKYRASIAKADAGLVAAERARVGVTLEVAQKAAEKYWDWVAAGRKVALAKELLQRATDRDVALGARVTQGDAAAIDRTDNARALLAREAQVVSAERSLGKARLELSLYLRDNAGQPILPDASRLPAGFPDPTPLPPSQVERAAAEAIRRRPDKARYDALARQYAVEEDYWDNQRLAAVDVTLTGAQQFGTGYPEKQPGMVEAALAVELPVRTRAQDGRRAVAGARKEQYEAQARLAGDKITVEVRDAALAVEAARLRAELAHREVDAARALEEAERRRFALGDGNLFLVNLREQATFDAAAKEIDTLAEHFKARAAWRAACGGD